MAKPKRKPQKAEKPAPKPDVFAKLIAHRISTAEIKTATPSRVQTKIQVRIAWTDPNGAHGLGYLSMDSRSAEAVARGKSSGPSFKNFFQDVFRTVKWAKKIATEENYTDADWGAYEDELQALLQGLGVFNADAKIHTIYKEAVDAIRACAADGKHLKARRSRLQARVKAAIGKNVEFALSQGLNDDEIRELVELAFVKHTMES